MQSRVNELYRYWINSNIKKVRMNEANAISQSER